VLDEPTSQLDPHSAEEVLTALQKLNADLGLTIVLSEHRLERVVQYVDRIVFCRPAGEEPPIVEGPPDQILRSAPFAPPLVEVARDLGWQPLPLTIKAARRFVANMILPPPTAELSPGLPRKSHSSVGPPATGLVVKDLSVELDGSPVLHAIDMELGVGEIVAIMGRNGSGKTTLLRAIMGLVRPSRGQIIAAGTDIGRLDTEERSRLLGYVPQDPRTMLFQPTIWDELAWTLERAGVGDPEETAEQRIERILVSLGLRDLARVHPRDLSAGEQQRAALATMLVRDPPIVLLDEPTRGLDYLNKNRLVETLRHLRAGQRAIALVTHDVELVAACADRVVLLGDGEVVTTGPSQTLLRESLLFSSQIGKLFPGQRWLTASDALAALRRPPVDSP
jgi:energy-coupling factor transport system ATP-binding protein